MTTALKRLWRPITLAVVSVLLLSGFLPCCNSNCQDFFIQEVRLINSTWSGSGLSTWRAVSADYAPAQREIRRSSLGRYIDTSKIDRCVANDHISRLLNVKYNTCRENIIKEDDEVRGQYQCIRIETQPSGDTQIEIVFE